MKLIQVFGVAMAIALAACSGGKSSVVSLDDMPVVTHQEMKDGQEVTVCDLELITDTIDLPLSYFVEDLQMVRLDNRDEALVGKDACPSPRTISWVPKVAMCLTSYSVGMARLWVRWEASAKAPVNIP